MSDSDKYLAILGENEESLLKSIGTKRGAIQVEDADPEALAENAARVQRTVEADGINSLRDKLTLVREAIARIRTGNDFGKCQKCDEPISAKRLDAIPWARLCIECEQRSSVKASTKSAPKPMTINGGSRRAQVVPTSLDYTAGYISVFDRIVDHNRYHGSWPARLNNEYLTPPIELPRRQKAKKK